MRKIINEATNFVDEVLEGILAAHPDDLRRAPGSSRAVVRRDDDESPRVAIITGGGSGHLPLFLGYVGAGLLDGVAVGNVFSSPSAGDVLAASRAVERGCGVLFLYGNYGGDVVSFDSAAEMLAREGIEVMSVRGSDDVLSAPADAAADRRGVAGLALVAKVAGAAAARGDSLAEVARVTYTAVAATRTVGVGLSPTILPVAGTPTFELEDGLMEIGIGIHGERGTHRGPLECADEIADRFLDAIIVDLDLRGDEQVAVLVNGLGATPLEELYLLYRRCAVVLAERGIIIRHRYVGEYATSLEMAGASVTVTRLTDELGELLDAPASAPLFDAWPPAPVRTGAVVHKRQDAGSADEGPVAPFAIWLSAVLDRWRESAPELRALDAELGDGDLGITVAAGSAAARAAIAQLPADASISAIIARAAEAFTEANPATFSGLLGMGGRAAAESLAEREDDIAAAVHAAERAIARRGGAALGEKTMLDPIHAAMTALDASPNQPAAVAADAAAAAELQLRPTTSRRGRASWAGERSAGRPDPGSIAIVRLLEAAAAVDAEGARSVSGRDSTGL